MFRDRLAIAILLIPITLWIVDLGGPVYTLGVLIVFVIAGVEYVRLFRGGGLRPSMPIVTGGIAALILAHSLTAFRGTMFVLAVMVILALLWHLIDYEQGAPASGTDFGVTLGGLVYLGFLSSYLVALRQLPDGKWWVLLVLPGVWLVDTGAYSVGRAFGRHKMVPRLSPHKSWEGFAGGILGGTIFTALLSAVWHIGAGPNSQVTALNGALVGAALGVLTPIGDLGVSMIKRQFNLKDTGALLPGHGGALDRTDSWLVAGFVGYVMAVWLMNSGGVR